MTTHIAPLLQGMLTGAAFGAVLYKVGATRYSRVMGMLTLRDAKIMKFAFSGIATASLLYGLAAALGVAADWNLVPRVMPFLGGAHVLGGVLFGLGMGFSGLCPGTCVAKAGGQGGNVKGAAPASILGLVVGVLVYDAIKDSLLASGIMAAQQKPLTLHGVLGLPYEAVALVFGAVMFGVTLLVDRFLPEKVYDAPPASLLDRVRGEWPWLAGGVAAGCIIVLATMQGGYLGFSGAVLAAVGWVAQLVGHPLAAVPSLSDDLLWRAALILGVFPGGFLAAKLSIKPQEAAQAAPAHFDAAVVARSFGAGAVMCLGAMVGGGCTTGAFIAAWPTLSLGSFAMAGTFFVTSILVGNARILVRNLDLPKAQLEGQRVYD